MKRKTSLGADASLICGMRLHPDFCLGEFGGGPASSLWRPGAGLFTGSFSRLEDSRSVSGSQPYSVRLGGRGPGAQGDKHEGLNFENREAESRRSQTW